jgi:hypothetical protein
MQARTIVGEKFGCRVRISLALSECFLVSLTLEMLLASGGLIIQLCYFP